MLGFIAMATQAQAQAQSMCGERAAMLKAITGKYNEAPVAIARAGAVNVIEVFASKAGTWTFLVTTPDGRSCMFAAGDGWKDLPPKMPGVDL